MAGQYIFETIEEAQEQATEWLWTYNNERPNMGIGGIDLPPPNTGPFERRFCSINVHENEENRSPFQMALRLGAGQQDWADLVDGFRGGNDL